jgi:hypothetical protein
VTVRIENSNFSSAFQIYIFILLLKNKLVPYLIPFN